MVINILMIWENFKFSRLSQTSILFLRMYPIDTNSVLCMLVLLVAHAYTQTTTKNTILRTSSYRSGTKRRRHSHIRLVLREIDFQLKIAQAKTLNQKKRWAIKRALAEAEGETAQAEREEIKQLEREAEKRRVAEEATKGKK